MLTAGGIWRLLEQTGGTSTVPLSFQVQVYFPGDCKGHIFQVLSSKYGGTVAHKKQLEKFT